MKSSQQWRPTRKDKKDRNRARNTEHDFLTIPLPALQSLPPPCSKKSSALLRSSLWIPAHSSSDLRSESASKNSVLTAIAVCVGVLASNCKQPWGWRGNWVHQAHSRVCIHNDFAFPEGHLEMLSGKQNKNSVIHDLGNKSTQKNKTWPRSA